MRKKLPEKCSLVKCFFGACSSCHKVTRSHLQVQISYLRGHVPTSKLHLRRLNNNNNNNNNNGGNLSGTVTGTATSIASEGDLKMMIVYYFKLIWMIFFSRNSPKNAQIADQSIPRKRLDDPKQWRNEHPIILFLLPGSLTMFLLPGSLTSTEPRSRSSDEPSDDWTVSRGGERRDWKILFLPNTEIQCEDARKKWP